MAHRDPETGRFVADSDVDRFTDYEFQHIANQYVVDAADLPGAFPIEESDLNIVDMDDLLHRDERADLVALNVHSIQATVPGTSSAESALLVRWELTLGAGDEMVLSEDAQIDTNTGSSGVIDKASWDSDSPDILYSAHWVAEGGYADSTNGLGGGPDQPVITDSVHYPREFGACPDLDERDDISESILLADRGGADISDSLIQINVVYSLVFAVHER
jgi:hypothetical protein